MSSHRVLQITEVVSKWPVQLQHATGTGHLLITHRKPVDNVLYSTEVNVNKKTANLVGVRPKTT